MSKRQFSVVVVLAFVGGVVGGLVSNQFFAGESVFAQKTPARKIVEANEFRLVDDEGSLRATLGISSLGSGVHLFDGRGLVRPLLCLDGKEGPRLMMSDANHAPRTTLSVGEGPAMLTFYDANHKARSVLGVHKGGEPALGMWDARGKLRASLDMRTDGRVGLSVNGKNEERRAELGLGREEGASVVLADGTGKERVIMAVAEDGDGGLTMYDGNQAMRAMLGLVKGEGPSFQMADEKRRLRTAMALTGGGEPHIGLLDTNQKLIWEAP